MGDDRADVLVIGAGAGGAVAALRLARAGAGVVCLEQGGWTDRADYPGTDPTWELQAGGRWSSSPGVRRAPADYPIDVGASDMGTLNFNGVGGGTVLYNAQWPRMLADDFRVRSLDGVADDWPLTYDELRPHYEETDRQFGVSGLGGNPAYPPGEDPPLPPLPTGEIGLRVARAHHRLGWHWWPATNAIASAPYEGRHVCVRRGTCGQGCNEGAKGSTDVTHWPAFRAAGGTLVTGARVRRVVTGPDGLALGAEWIDRDGREQFTPAAIVLVAANAIGTARLLLASADARHPDGLANSSGLVGRRLMLHPLSTVSGRFDEPLRGWRAQNGALIQSLEFARTDPERGFVRGSTWGLGSSAGPLRAALSPAGRGTWGPEHHANVESRLGRTAQWAILCEDLPEESNRVHLDPHSVDSDGMPGVRVQYRFSENSRRMMAFMAARAAESLREAGAGSIESMIGIPNGHLMGTARMGADPQSSVVDAHGMSHDVPNLGVVDGSVFVTAGSANPTSTIAALALRTAEHLVARRRWVPSSSGGRSVIAVGAPNPHPTVVALPSPLPAPDPAHVLSDAERALLERLADVLVPGTADRPTPSAVGIGHRLLDQALAARPDLVDPLRRSLRAGPDAVDLPAAERLLAALDADDPRAASALRTCVAGGYYMAPEVRAALGYDGQEAAPVPAFGYPEYLEEGLLDHLV
jgi:choline dehydrogenase-like flavoprotein